MKTHLSSWLLVVALALSAGLYGDVSAQVVEEREQGASNPGKVIFRTTLYGAATGLVLGGAYALVEEDDDLSTGEILKWGVAGGAAAGFVIGLIYVVARPDPKGDIEDLEREGEEESSGIPTFEVPSFTMLQRRDLLGNKDKELAVHLVNVRF